MSEGWAVVVSSNGDNLQIFKNITGDVPRVRVITSTTIFGSAVDIGSCHACVRSDGKINIVAAAVSNSPTRNTAYALYNPVTNVFDVDWESIGVYSQAAPAVPHIWCGTDDDGDDPAVVWLDVIRVHGTNFDQVKFATREAGSWSGQQLVNTGTQTNYTLPRLFKRTATTWEAVYVVVTNRVPVYRARVSGTWGTEDVGVNDEGESINIITDSSGAIILGSSDTNDILFGTDVDTLSDILFNVNVQSEPHQIAITTLEDNSGTDQEYIFYISSVGANLHALHRTRTGNWNDAKVLEGSFSRVIAEWSFQQPPGANVYLMFETAAGNAVSFMKFPRQAYEGTPSILSTRRSPRYRM